MIREKLIAARENKGWTQLKLSEAMDVDVSTIVRWEHGISRPQGRLKRKLTQLLGAAAEELGLEKDQQTIYVPQREARLTRFAENDLTMQLLALAHPTVRGGYQKTQNRLIQIIKEHEAYNMADSITRRDALRRLAALPFITLNLNSESFVIHAADHVLNQCAASIAACWQLSKSQNEEDLQDAFDGATAYMSVLKEVARDASGSGQRKMAASLVGQCGSLKTVLGWHLEGLREAAMYGREALGYSEGAEDIPLQTAIHTQLAWVYYYGRQYQQSLKEADAAAALLKKSDKLPHSLHSSVHSTRAIRQALYNKDQDATASLRLAHKHFNPGSEELRYIYVDHDQSSLILEGGMTYAQLGRHDTALDSFSQIIDPKSLRSKIPVPERVRIEVLNNQTMSLLKSKQGDMHQAVKLWKASVQGSIELQSEQRFSEALTVYQAMETLWPGEREIADLRECIVHW